MGYGKINNIQNQPILTQTVNFTEGWGLFSFYVDVNAQHIPGLPCREITMDEIFGTYSSYIEEIQQWKPGVIPSFWWPGNSASTFQTFDKSVGYQIKTNTPFSITVKGPRISPRKEILHLKNEGYFYTQCSISGATGYTDCATLEGVIQPDPNSDIGYGYSIFNGPGWSVMPYHIPVSKNVVGLLGDFATPSSDDILLVKDSNGNLWWPEFGINFIGNLIPGQGYFIRVKNDVDIFYPGI